MDKNLIIEILKDIIDYSDHFPVDDEIYNDYAEKITKLLDQPCGISVKEATKNVGKNVMYRGQHEKILSNPLSHRDLIFLERLEKCWAKAWFLRPQIKRFKSSERVRLMDAPDLQHTWERRVYYWYLSQSEGIKDEQGQFHEFTELPVKTIMIALFHFYPKLFSQAESEYMEKWKRTKNLNLFVPVKVNNQWSRKKNPMPATLLYKKERIKYIRNKAQRDLSRYKKKGVSHDEILEKRGITKANLDQFKKTYKNFSFDPNTGFTDDNPTINDIQRL